MIGNNEVYCLFYVLAMCVHVVVLWLVLTFVSTSFCSYLMEAPMDTQESQTEEV